MMGCICIGWINADLPAIIHDVTTVVRAHRVGGMCTINDYYTIALFMSYNNNSV